MGQDTHTLVFERQIAHPREKVWRALTQSWLIEEWLMPNDFVARVGHCFTVRAQPLPGWSGVTHCEVTLVQEPSQLAYSWGNGTESANGLVTHITWTLQERDGGTLLRMEQSGFRPSDGISFERMGGMWPRILAQLDQVAGRH